MQPQVSAFQKTRAGNELQLVGCRGELERLFLETVANGPGKRRSEHVAWTQAQGVEYLTRVTIRAPDGSTHIGAAHVELFINGPYHPLNLK
jgi:hypothetical protein